MDNITNKTCKFMTKNWIEVYDDAHRHYNTNNQTRFKNSMLMSYLCNQSDAYTLPKGTITVPTTTAVAVVQIIEIKN